MGINMALARPKLKLLRKQGLAVPSLPTPVIPRGLLPGRVAFMLVPRLSQYAQRITAKVAAYAEVPETTLAVKFISGSVGPDSLYYEYYALMIDGNPEGFFVLCPYKEGVIGCEASRCGYAKLEILLDDVLKLTFPEVSGTGPWIGYGVFDIPIETAA